MSVTCSNDANVSAVEQDWLILPHPRVIFEEELNTQRANATCGTDALVLALEALCVRDEYDPEILNTIQKLSSMLDGRDVLLQNNHDAGTAESESEEEVARILILPVGMIALLSLVGWFLSRHLRQLHHTCSFTYFQVLSNAHDTSPESVSSPLLPPGSPKRVCVSHRKLGWPCGELDDRRGTILLDNGIVLSAGEAQRALWFYEEEFRLQLKWQRQMAGMQVNGRHSL